MSRSLRHLFRFPLVAGLCGCFLLAPSDQAQAGIGYDGSPPALLDTRAPLLELDNVPEHLTLHAGESYLFQWTSDDDNPGQTEDDFLAVILADDQVLETLSWFPHDQGDTWDWTAPEVQSALVRLEVTVRDIMGNTTHASTDPFTVLYSTTDAGDLPAAALSLGPAVPNPFNPSCRLQFQVPQAGQGTLAVHDLRGRRVKLLQSGPLAQGVHTVRWDGTDTTGRPQPGGLYFFVLEFRGPEGAQRLTRQAVLIP